MKKLDLKTYIIIILGVILLLVIFFGGNKKPINSHADEIKKLNEETTRILKINDSLKKVNVKLDADIKLINDKLAENNRKNEIINNEINKLKKKNNEIPNYVKHLDANDVSNAFSIYLQGRTKDSGNN